MKRIRAVLRDASPREAWCQWCKEARIGGKRSRRSHLADAVSRARRSCRRGWLADAGRARRPVTSAGRPACASTCGQAAISRRPRWISATRPVDSQKNLVITDRTPCATRRGGSRKSLTTEGGPVPGETRGARGGAGRPAISRGARYPVAAGRRIGRRVIGSRARPGRARPLHLIHGGASAHLTSARSGHRVPLIPLFSLFHRTRRLSARDLRYYRPTRRLLNLASDSPDDRRIILIARLVAPRVSRACHRLRCDTIR